jgi:methylated-DNA-[protein]-cysteine S-methyltransferase
MKNDTRIKYAIFQTKFGWFGIAGTKKYLLRTHLPQKSLKSLQKKLLKGLENPQKDPKYFIYLQKRVQAYFENTNFDDFKDVPVKLENTTDFTRRVLMCCRKIRPSLTISYGELAKRIGNPKTSRAVGAALAKNPLPLIIPCHRIIRKDGKPGGFSAPGGKRLKKKLLQLESQNIQAHI